MLIDLQYRLRRTESIFATYRTTLFIQYTILESFNKMVYFFFFFFKSTAIVLLVFGELFDEILRNQKWQRKTKAIFEISNKNSI
jgi:hypothetical protein